MGAQTSMGAHAIDLWDESMSANKEILVRLMLLAASAALCVPLGEAVVRVIDGYELLSLRLIVVPQPIFGVEDDAVGTPAEGGWVATSGVEREWFVRDPPRPAGKDRNERLLELYRAAPPEVGYGSIYQWNLEFLRDRACRGAVSSEAFDQFERIFYYTPLDGSILPRYRFIRNVTDPSGMVINRFGYRGPQIAVNKPPETIRIAFVGASTTVSSHGYPYSYPEHIAHWLAMWGRRAFPNIRFEVINAGRSGISSPDIRAVVRSELLPLEPDMLVYYEGSNSFWPVDYLDWPDGRLPERPAVSFVLKSPLENYSSLLRRLLALLDAGYHGDGAEPEKVAHTVTWPAEIDEFDPDPDYPGLPTGLTGIIGDMEGIRTDLMQIGAEFVPSSFVWMVWDDMRLALPRHARLFQALNQSYGIFTYAHLRRMVDFQNRVFRNYAASRGLEFIDIAALFPRDPNLVRDAIHNTPEGIRVRGWIVFQQLVPMLRHRIEQGALPKLDRERITAHPALAEPRFQSTTWAKLLRSCD